MTNDTMTANPETQIAEEFETPTLHLIGNMHAVVLGVSGGGFDGGFGFTEPGFEFEPDDLVRRS